ncbi:MAG: TonB-dependent receptor, partial [Methylococcaceae bacterium]|nr:TonB-dependent receptor [Methylococcaceae bacterium]
GDVHFDLGARVEFKDFRPEAGAPERDFIPYTLNLGGKWPLARDYLLAVNLSRAQRAPQVQELYANGRHVATPTFEIGDPGLNVETSNNIDLALSKTEGRWQWSLNGFYNFYEDFIFLQEVDSNADGQADRVDDEGNLAPDGPFLSVRDQQQNAQFYGVEAESGHTLLSGEPGDLNIRIWGDWVRAEFTNGGNVPRLPPWRLGGSLDYTSGNWSANLDLWRAGRQDQTSGVETETPGYTMLNLNLIYKFPTPSTDFSIFLRATNLLDQDARRSTSFLKEVAPLPGRAATLGVRGEF